VVLGAGVVAAVVDPDVVELRPPPPHETVTRVETKTAKTHGVFCSGITPGYAAGGAALKNALLALS